MARINGDYRRLQSIAPGDWHVFWIDDAATRGTGHTPDKGVPEYWDGGISWISLTDCNRLDKVFISETTKTISQKGIENSSAVLHPAGIVVMSRDAGVGRSAITTQPMAVSQHFVVWYCGDKLHNVYLYYWLQLLKPEFERIANGSTIKTIGMPYFAKLGVMCPKKPEQIRVANVLYTWDRGIEHLEKSIACNRRFRQGLMQQLLTGKRRFKGFTDEWHPIHLKDVTEECSERNQGQLGIEAVMAVTKAEGIVPMRERTIAADIDRYLVVKKDCFAYNPMRINIGSIARWNGDNDILVSPDYVVFRCKEPIKDGLAVDPDFLDQYRRSGLWQRYVASSGNGSVRVRIYYSDLGVMKLRLPPIKEQRKIAGLLNTADREIDLLSRKLNALKKQKRGLMQELLTGQIRVKANERTRVR